MATFLGFKAPATGFDGDYFLSGDNNEAVFPPKPDPFFNTANQYFNKKDSFQPLSSTINRAYQVLYEAIEKGFFADTLLILLKPIPILSWDGVRLGEKEQLEVFEIAKKVLFKLKELNSIEATSKQASEIIKNNLKFKE